MNYKELEKANGLLNEIRDIDFHIRQIEHPRNCARITVDDYFISFNDKYKERFVNILKEIRAELIEELKELGVTENE